MESDLQDLPRVVHHCELSHCILYQTIPTHHDFIGTQCYISSIFVQGIFQPYHFFMSREILKLLKIGNCFHILYLSYSLHRNPFTIRLLDIRNVFLSVWVCLYHHWLWHLALIYVLWINVSEKLWTYFRVRAFCAFPQHQLGPAYTYQCVRWSTSHHQINKAAHTWS